jgi:spermidine/putrescine transport system permease protein
MFSRGYKYAVSLPPLLWVTAFLLAPHCLLFAYSFWTVSPAQTIVPDWNMGNYRELLRSPMYLAVLFRSMKIAGSVTALALLLAYPLAYYLSFCSGVKKDLLYQFVIIPLWVSYLVRAYAWKTILGSDGVLNSLLKYLHVVQQPVDFLLYSPFAVVLTLTHIYMPFAFMPVYASLEHIPRNLIEASTDLGASPMRTFWRVVFPLSLPGVLAGATFAFVLSLGDFLAPLLIGGPSRIMISNIVVSLFGAAYNWPLGAAISLCMLLLVVGLLFLVERVERKLSFSRENRRHNCAALAGCPSMQPRCLRSFICPSVC